MHYGSLQRFIHYGLQLTFNRSLSILFLTIWEKLLSLFLQASAVCQDVFACIECSFRSMTGTTFQFLPILISSRRIRPTRSELFTKRICSSSERIAISVH